MTDLKTSRTPSKPPTPAISGRLVLEEADPEWVSELLGGEDDADELPGATRQQVY